MGEIGSQRVLALRELKRECDSVTADRKIEQRFLFEFDRGCVAPCRQAVGQIQQQLCLAE